MTELYWTLVLFFGIDVGGRLLWCARHELPPPRTRAVYVGDLVLNLIILVAIVVIWR